MGQGNYTKPDYYAIIQNMKKLLFTFILLSVCCLYAKEPVSNPSINYYKGLSLKFINRYDPNGNKIYVYSAGSKSEDFLKYNSKNQLIKQENSKTKSSVENKYHSNGKLAYRKTISGTRKEEIWYDVHGCKTKRIDLLGKKSTTVNEYNPEGKIIHRKSDSGNYEEWYEYSASGYSCHGKEYNLEWWRTFDSQDNIIYEKTITDGSKIEENHLLYEYNKNGNIIHYKNEKEGIEQWNEYDADDKCVHTKSSDGTEYFFEYNAAGKCTHMKFSDGTESFYEYDAAGKCTHMKFSDGTECFYEYDSIGNEIYYKAKDGKERRTVYEYYSNGKIKEARIYN